MPWKRRFQYEQSAFPPIGVPITPPGDDTANPSLLNTGVTFRRTVQYQSLAFVAVVVSAVALDWFSPLPEPVRQERGVKANQQQSLAFVPLVDSDTPDWYQPWVDPTRIKRGLKAAQQQYLALDPFPRPPDVSEAQWHQPWSELPVKTKRWLDVALQQLAAFLPLSGDCAFDSFAFQNDTFQVCPPFDHFGLDSGQFATPVRAKRGLPANEQQFLAFVAPTTETITVDKWFEPLTEPRRAKRPVVQLQFTVIDTDPIVPFGWNSALSEPKRVAPSRDRQIYAFVPVTAETITVDKWFAPLPEPVRLKPGLSAAKQQVFTTGAAPDPFDWIYPLPEPKRVVPPRNYDWDGAYAVPFEIVTPDKWFEALSEPTRTERRVAWQQFDAFAPTQTTEVVTVDKWFEPYSTPTLRIRGTFQQFISSFDPKPEDVLESKWHQPWSEPTRRKQGLSAAEQQFFTFDTNPTPVVVGMGWFTQFPDLVKNGEIGAAYQGYLQGTFSNQPGPAVDLPESKWHQGWSEPPVKTKRGLEAALQRQPALDPFPIPETPPTPGDDTANPALLSGGVTFTRTVQYQQLAFVALTTFEDVTVDKWYEALGEPKRVIPPRNYDWDGAYPVPFVPEIVTLDKWFKPYSEPTRTERRVAQQQDYAAVPTQTTEVVTVDKWFEAYSEPPHRIRATFQQFIPAFDSKPEDVLESKWHQPWSEPTRRKRAPYQQFFAFDLKPITAVGVSWLSPLSSPVKKDDIGAAYQGYLQGTFSNQPEAVLESKWHQPWSLPVRYKRGLRANLQQFQTLPQAVPFVVKAGWERPWSEPVRFKRGVRAAQQQFIAQFLLAPKVYWLPPLQEPVRHKRGLLAAQQQFFAINLTVTLPVTSANWFEPLSEPVRHKTGLRANLQQFEVFDPFPRPSTYTIGWLRPLNEPVRQKRGLQAKLQQSFTIDPKQLTLKEAVLESKWHQAWSEPTRKKRGVLPRHQQFLAFAQPGKDYIIAILDTTETPDVFSGVITVNVGGNSADVSISTQTPEYANVSSVYDTVVFADVTVRTTTQVFANVGSVYEPITTFADVSIRSS